MRLLLDTHSFLWFIGGDPKLSNTARGLIEDPANDRFLSAGSLWEVAIKVSLGKLSLSAPFEEIFPEQLRLSDVQLLGITITHATEVARLPFHHRDPFDRLLIAQARAEQMPIVSADTAFDAYLVRRLW